MYLHAYSVVILLQVMQPARHTCSASCILSSLVPRCELNVHIFYKTHSRIKVSMPQQNTPNSLKSSTGLWQNVIIQPRTHSSDEGLEYLHLLVSPSWKSDLPVPPAEEFVLNERSRLSLSRHLFGLIAYPRPILRAVERQKWWRVQISKAAAHTSQVERHISFCPPRLRTK